MSALQEFIQAYISSITSLEEDHVLQAAKDSGGARVIEGFLGSNASGKQKRKLVVKYVIELHVLNYYYCIIIITIIIYYYCHSGLEGHRT